MPTHTPRLSPLLKATSVSIERSQQTIVNDVSLNVSAGELVGLIGPNGAGKSTLLASLAGIETPKQGLIELHGKSLWSLNASERALHIGWVEQMGAVHWPITVERLVMLGRIPHLPAWCRAQEEDRHAVATALTISDCDSLKERQVSTLSGGERARVLLARALAANPTLLFADEPISTLDLGHQLQTMQLLRDFACGDKACVVVMHDLSLAARYCDRLYLMHQGRMAASGPIASVLSSENLDAVYGVSVISGDNEVPWIIPVKRLR